MSKPQRQCIFCDNPANSKEHLWSQWMHPLLGRDPAAKYNRHTFTSWPDGRTERSGPTEKAGSAFHIQVRAVCKQCNSTWMNRIEGGVRPFLDEMIQGKPVTLNADQIRAFAKWCALKCIVMEHASHDVAVTPRADCIAFKESGQIPAYFRIYAGNHNTEYQCTLMRSSHCMALSFKGPVPPLDGTSKNIQTLTLLLGRLFVHFNVARIADFEIEKAYFISRIWSECQIWPNTPESRRWPHRPLLDARGLAMLGNSLDTLFSLANTAWFERMPGSEN